jgi:hypothetical protein
MSWCTTCPRRTYQAREQCYTCRRNGQRKRVTTNEKPGRPVGEMDISEAEIEARYTAALKAIRQRVS